MTFALSIADAIMLEARVATAMCATIHQSLPRDAPDEVRLHVLHRAGYTAREITRLWPVVKRHFDMLAIEQNDWLEAAE
jgi:hypothetical protein